MLWSYWLDSVNSMLYISIFFTVVNNVRREANYTVTYMSNLIHTFTQAHNVL